MRGLVAVALSLATLAGCSSVEVDEAAFEHQPPQRIAVLPLEVSSELAAEDPGAAHEATIVTEQLRASLEESTYLQLSTAALRRVLRARGWDDPAALRAATSRRVSDALGVDAVLRGRLEAVDNLQGGVIYRRTIQARLRLVRRDGRVLATLVARESDTGGLLLLGHSQLLETIDKTLINNSEHGFHHLSARFSEEIVSKLPQPPELVRPAEPALSDFQVEASRAGERLRPGDRLVLLAKGDPGLFVRVRFGQSYGFLTLEESSPGVYRGEHVITLGEAWEGGVRALASDPWGQGAECLAAARYRVSARALPAPTQLSWVRRGEGSELRWEPVPGASAYAVQSLAPGGALRRTEE
ncbi:MAG TPA: hypothetical protein DEA08_06845, partial [Planctomycetes bacterium]|nr:hypothetical protein [Planctomycetota bacterium]